MARVSVNGELLAVDIKVKVNCLRQGYTMAPVLSNLYTCLVFERWSSKVADLDSVETLLLYKFALQKVHQKCLQGPAD